MTTDIEQDSVAEGGKRDSRTLFPLWRVRGTVTLRTPLSIGSGNDEPLGTEDKDSRHVLTVVRNHQGQPCIPASGFKGALTSLARQTGMPAATRERLFGKEENDRTFPGLVEFVYLMPDINTLPADSGLPNWSPPKHAHTANIPHSVRNRDYGSAEDKLLFLEQVVPPGVRFSFECTARAIEKQDIAALLGLLQLAGEPDGPFQLGGSKSADNGRIEWKVDEVRQLDNFNAFWQTLTATGAAADLDIWSDSCSTALSLSPDLPSLSASAWLNLKDISLTFHTPVLVHQYQEKTDQEPAHGKPRTNHAGKPVLPSDSLHGALRTQAERILRTLGVDTPPAYQVKPIGDVREAAHADLASVLFGATGWKSLVALTDYTVQGEPQYLTHEMVAIDRVTGSGKDSAKFTVKALDCPTLTGTLRLDIRRLAGLERHNPDITVRALGLLAYVLRDLDEGDLALGYGAAKGYGRSHSETWRALDAALRNAKPGGIDEVGKALQAFSQSVPAAASSPALGTGLEHEPAAPVATEGEGDFHNPYAFIPFGEPKPKDARLPWAGYRSIAGRVTHHSHDRSSSIAFNGRLVCRLKTVTPIFIGAGNVPGTKDPKQKENFRLKKDIALPATSLRGMLSSLHEAITCSALRVLDECTYSVRLGVNNRQDVMLNGRPYTAVDALGSIGFAPLSRQRQRNLLSPSEVLFGSVEMSALDTDVHQDKINRTAMAFASKVLVGYGRAMGAVKLLDEVPLKILSSPKPPSPAMYFRPRTVNDRYISKASLIAAANDYALRGRKVYLHGLRGEGPDGLAGLDHNGEVTNSQLPPWQSQPPDENARKMDCANYTKNNNQRVRIKPIAKDQEFFFEVDFANLSQDELESLCACIVPHSSYEHKLGMGKPIGLGSIKIDIVGMYLVDRAARYQQTDFANSQRYAAVWKPEQHQLPGHLKREEDAQHDSHCPSPVHLANVQMAALKSDDRAVFAAITLTGNPDAVKKPVHYPQLESLDIEKETYKWFVDNDGTRGHYNGPQKFLESFTEGSTALPALSGKKRDQCP